MAQFAISSRRADDYPEQIKKLRSHLGLTQQALSEKLGVSFATVNRWENGQTKPSQLSWTQLRQLLISLEEETSPQSPKSGAQIPPFIDFTASPEIVKVLAEGERLSFRPPGQSRLRHRDLQDRSPAAPADRRLRSHAQAARLRFLLADDAGAGKTIMSGLYIREMLSRRLLRRILIVPPAGLVGNWQRELSTLFNLPFRHCQR